MMMDFFKAICSGAALLSLALLFVPERPELKRATLSFFSLLFLLLLIPKDGSLPLGELFSPPDAPDASYEEGFENVLTDTLRESVAADIASRFSLDKTALRIESDLSLSDTALSGSYLTVFLGKQNFFADATAVVRYVKNTYFVDCEVRFIGDEAAARCDP